MADYDLPTLNSIIRGDYEKIRFTVLKADRSGPQDITGWEFKFAAKLDISDTTPIIVKESGSFDIPDPETGVGYIILEGEETSAVTYPLTLICDVQGTDTAGKNYTGKFKLPVELDVSE